VPTNDGHLKGDGDGAVGSPSSGTVTSLLHALRGGDAAAGEQLYRLVYAELRALARWRMRGEPAGHTLQPTALLHEAYLRLVGAPEIEWENRAHFFGAAAEAMRRILVERARRVGRTRHGGRLWRVELHDGSSVCDPRLEEVLAIDLALDRLAAVDERMARVVVLRFFGGLTTAEIALAIATSERTVGRLWRGGRAWLRREMGERAPLRRAAP
jgi:RNA polymerase sigma factor (TIGR02999 family)